MPVQDELLLTPTEAADLVRKTPATLANERHRGEGLPYVKIGNSIRYRAADVLTALEDGTAGFTWKRLAAALERYGLDTRERNKLVSFLQREL